MATTIDHLGVDRIVKVTRAFTDSKGIAVPAGTKGLLTHLGQDWATSEIIIEWERDGKKQELRFPLRTSDGPRIGKMRDYFEVVEPALPPPLPKTEPPPAPAEYKPERPAGSLSAYVSTQPGNDTSLRELRVACDCDHRLHLPILDQRGEWSVYGCVGCGTVTCSRTFGDDGRHTGNSWQENRTVGVTKAVLAWLGTWPRATIDRSKFSLWPMSINLVRYPTVYFPADTRCKTLAALAELESRFMRDQAGQTHVERLRAACHSVPRPPSEVPAELGGFVALWQALQLKPASPLDELLLHAQLRSLGSAVAAETLGRRADAFDLITSHLRPGSGKDPGLGFAIAREQRPIDPRLAGFLTEQIGELSLTPRSDTPDTITDRGRAELILQLAAELNLSSPEMLATLRAFMRKVARHDSQVAEHTRTVVGVLAPNG